MTESGRKESRVIYIVDLSEWQAPSAINYDTFAKQLDLAIVRVQYGSGYKDKHYKTHITELQKRGVPVAVYAWVRGKTVAEMEEEAQAFYSRAKVFKPVFWWLDVEEQSMKDIRVGVSAYQRKLRALGVGKVGVYIAHHLYGQFNINVAEFDAVWIPHYGRNDGTRNSKPSYPCDLHQYTDRGRLPGYNGDLDLNAVISNREVSFFSKGVEAVAEENKPKVDNDPDVYLSVRVRTSKADKLVQEIIKMGYACKKLDLA